jgi:DNA-binding transcriptional LysR family regulator
MEMPTLRQLEYLVAVAEQGTFGAAAEAVHVSQPAMSAQIAELEQKLGVTLFERDRRGARVTPEGEAIVTAARRVLAEAGELVRLASDRRGDLVGQLTLGVIPTMAPYLLPTVVREIRRRYPATELRLRELRTAELVAALLDGTLDLGLLAAPVPELDARCRGRRARARPVRARAPGEPPVRRHRPAAAVGARRAPDAAAGGGTLSADPRRERLYADRRRASSGRSRRPDCRRSARWSRQGWGRRCCPPALSRSRRGPVPG